MIRISRKEDCCGCTACESICGKKAISLVPDNEGFLYPIIDANKCVDCGLCEKVCPIIYRKDNKIKPQYKGLYALRSKNQAILQGSSSGGAFSALAHYFIENGGVVVGATYDQEMVVRHVCIETMDEMPKLRGSKYVQSNTIGVFRKIKSLLSAGKLVLFSGSPCQVEGLRLFLKKEYENLTTIDIVCHATGSPQLFKEYINYVEEKLKNKIVWMNMRDKKNYGWSHRFSQRIWLKDGNMISEKEGVFPWWQIFYSHLTNRPCCHECHYTNMSRPGDITIADFWDDKRLRPDIYSTEGTSLCIINTNKGDKIFSQIKEDYKTWTVTEKEAWQPCLESPTPANIKRANYWSFYREKGFLPAYKKFIYVPQTVRIKWKIKDFIAKLIRYGKKT